MVEIVELWRVRVGSGVEGVEGVGWGGVGVDSRIL